MNDWLILVAMAALIGLIAWRSGALTQSGMLRAAGSITLAIGLVATVVLLAVAMLLTGKLWSDVRGATTKTVPASAAAPASVHPVAVPASATAVVPPSLAPQGAAGKPGEDDGKDALSNAMTAIGTVVAVVALVLSVGTSWFGQQQERLRAQTDAVAALHRDLERTLQLERLRWKAIQALPAAKLALSNWLRGRTKEPAAYANEWGLLLEMLAADSRTLRGEAFDRLIQGLPRYEDSLRPVRDYAELCHELACERALLGPDGQAPPSREVLRCIEDGLWCRIFDRSEQDRWLAANGGLPSDGSAPLRPRSITASPRSPAPPTP